LYDQDFGSVLKKGFDINTTQ